MPSYRSIPLLISLAVAAGLPVPSAAQAGGPIYMCVDEHGRRIATNLRSEMKGRKCERQMETALPVSPGAKTTAKASGAASPSDFPKVGADAQKARDDVRRKVLAEEMANEQKLLDVAKQEANDSRLPRAGEDKSSQKYLNRLSETEKAVQRHQKNLESLQREIGNLR
jgi:hypothetical protein